MRSNLPTIGLGVIIGTIVAFVTSAYAVPIYSPITGHYYERVDSQVDWYTARDTAAGMTYMGVSGHLATVTSADENSWIVENLGGASTLDHFLGGLLVSGTWTWITGETWQYTNWFPREPSGDGAALEYDDAETPIPVLGQWNDYPAGGVELGFIVEYDTPSSPIPEPSTTLLLGTGLVGLVGVKKKFRKN